MTITDCHRLIFEYLETYRREHPEANLTYSLRRNSKPNRPRNQYLFTGSEKYILVGLYAQHNGNTKTRSIGFNVDYDPVRNTVKTSSLLIVYDDPKLINQEKIYEQLIQQIGPDQFNEFSPKRYELVYQNPDWLTNLQTYLEHHKPIIDRVIQQAGATTIFHIPEQELERDIEAINQSTQPTYLAPVKYWIFLIDVNDHTALERLRDDFLKVWQVTAYKKAGNGDKVIICVNGSEAGCYALAEIVSAGNPDYINQRVEIKVIKNLWEQPVYKEVIDLLPSFTDFNWESKGTNIRATPEQYKAIEQIIQSTVSASPRRYWKYSPGQNAARWSDDINEGIMAISFWEARTGSLDQYPTQADLDQFMSSAQTGGMGTNQTWNMLLFREAALNDVVIANRGRNTVEGIGIITGPYQYRDVDDLTFKRFPHYRAVKWLADKSWEYTPDLFPNQKSLFRIDTFSPTRVGAKIIQEYVQKYPEYRPVFEQHGLLETQHSDNQPSILMPDLYPKNIILYGPPGTGKTYETIDLAVDIIDGRKADDHPVNKTRFDELRTAGQIEFVTFHQNYTYEDFVMGLKPDVTSGSLRFEQREGIFYKLAKLARQNYNASRTDNPTPALRPFDEVFEEFMSPFFDYDKSINVPMASGINFQVTGIGERSVLFEKANGSRKHTLSINTLKRIYEGEQEVQPNGLKPYYLPLSQELIRLGQTDQTMARTQTRPENYVLIIDEINRANMSRVFGELITLLEDDKRLGGANELTITLPSGELFAVPPNLYLIGTMNTADKSLALLDVALRRRFEFIGKYPDYEVLDSQARDMLRRLNKIILEHKKSPDFLIGHAYFMGKQADQLPAVLNNRVIPLLLEYFNGRSDMVETILREAGIEFTRNELTYQLEVTNG